MSLGNRPLQRIPKDTYHAPIHGTKVSIECVQIPCEEDGFIVVGKPSSNVREALNEEGQPRRIYEHNLNEYHDIL